MGKHSLKENYIKYAGGGVNADIRPKMAGNMIGGGDGSKYLGVKKRSLGGPSQSADGSWSSWSSSYKSMATPSGYEIEDK